MSRATYIAIYIIIVLLYLYIYVIIATCMYSSSYSYIISYTQHICTGKKQEKDEELTATTIAKYQSLLRREFSVGGLQDPGYGIGYKFTAQNGSFVQILHVNNNHWICVSNIMSKKGINYCKLINPCVTIYIINNRTDPSV